MVYVPEHERSKMDTPTKPAIMLGYCDSQKGYRLWSHDQKKVFSARDVGFIEDQPRTAPKQVFLPITPMEDFEIDDNQEVPENSLKNLPQENDDPLDEEIAGNVPENQAENLPGKSVEVEEKKTEKKKKKESILAEP